MYETEIQMLRELLAVTVKPINPQPVLKDSPFVSQWLSGHGLEVGPSSSNDFMLKDCVKLSLPEWEDFKTHAEWQFLFSGTFLVPDIWADMDALPYKDSKFDYVFSSHVLEHSPNLIRTLREFARVTRKGGIVLTILPKRDALWQDRERPITPLSHFVEDFEQDLTAETHPRDPKYTGPRGHYHVFTPDSFIEVAKWTGLFTVEAVQDPDEKIGNGFTVVLRVK